MSIGSIEEWQRIAEAQAKGASQTDDGVMAMFYTKARQNPAETEIQGRMVCDNVPYVKIRIAGQPRNVIDREATDADKKRFPRAWAAYEAGKEGHVEGMPLEQWPLLNPAQVAELKAAGVYTVEQLAAVADGDLSRLGPGARNLRERAKQHLQGSGETERALREQVATQDQKISDLETKLRQWVESGQVEPQKRGPGRPRKTEASAG